MTDPIKQAIEAFNAISETLETDGSVKAISITETCKGALTALRSIQPTGEPVVDVEVLKMEHGESADDEAFIIGFDELINHINNLAAQGRLRVPSNGTFRIGDSVRKKGDKGQWHGRIVGTYSTECTPEGYAVESVYEKNSVQIYPASALELWSEEQKPNQSETINALVEALHVAVYHLNRGETPKAEHIKRINAALALAKKEQG